MAKVIVRVTGIDGVSKKLAELKLSDLSKILKAGALHIKGKIAQYPPSSSANTPGGPGSRWYERGYGPKWARKDGTVNGRKTSETLGKRWTIRRQSSLKWVIGNNASYAPFVQSAEKQAKFHAARGWKTDEQVVEEEEETVVKFVQDEIERIINS